MVYQQKQSPWLASPAIIETTQMIKLEAELPVILLYVNNTWPCERLHTLEQGDLETLWLLLRGSVMLRHVSHILVGVVYTCQEQTVDQ